LLDQRLADSDHDVGLPGQRLRDHGIPVDGGFEPRMEPLERGLALGGVHAALRSLATGSGQDEDRPDDVGDRAAAADPSRRRSARPSHVDGSSDRPTATHSFPRKTRTWRTVAATGTRVSAIFTTSVFTAGSVTSCCSRTGIGTEGRMSANASTRSRLIVWA